MMNTQEERIAVYNNKKIWAKYIEYLECWLDNHRHDNNHGMSPACFDEWYDCEFEEEVH